MFGRTLGMTVSAGLEDDGSGDDGAELAHRLAHVDSHPASPGVVDPPLEADRERRQAGLGGELRGGRGDAA